MENKTENRSPLGEAWIEAVSKHTEALNRQVEAIRYLADVIGFNADKLFEKGKNTPAPSMTVEHALPPDDTPVVPAQEPPPKTEPTLEDVRASMNAFARRQGKDAAFALIKKYSSSLKVEDIAPERYGELLMETSGGTA